MAKTTFTQTEHQAIRTAIGWLECEPQHDKKTVRALKSLNEKMEKALVKSSTTDCIGVARVLQMARDALGERLREHPNPTPAWYSTTHNRLKVNGITEDIAAKALANIVTSWKGEIFIDVLVNSLAKYSVMAIGKQQKTVSRGWLDEV